MSRLDRRTCIALAVVFVLALAVRFTYWAHVSGTALDEAHRFDQSDMATYIAQAKQFSGGDWLAREPVHPYHRWQSVAPAAKWLEWYGPHNFHQAPGYAYVLASLGALVSDPIAAVKFLQLVLGAFTACFALLLARELADLFAGVVAGALVALYAPLFYLEAQVLREGPVLCFAFALLYALARELRADSRTSLRRHAVCALFGVALGAFHMFHEIGLVLLAVALVALVAHHARDGWLAGAKVGAACALGYAVGFAPLLARNVEVGAAPFAVSCRALINFAQANEAGAPDGGASFDYAGPTLVKILDDAHGSFTGMLRGVWATYDGDAVLLAHNWSKRAAAICEAFEVPDNTSFDFQRLHVPALALAPNFALLFPLGCAGICAALVGAWRFRRGARDGFAVLVARHPRAYALLALYLVATACALSSMNPVARFRLYVTPVFFVAAGIAAVSLWDALRARRIAHVALIVAAIAFASLAQLAIARYGTVRQALRPGDFYVAAKVSIELHQDAAALAYADESVHTYTGDQDLYPALADEFERERNWVYAQACYRAALSQTPDSVDAQNGLARVNRALQALH